MKKRIGTLDNFINEKKLKLLTKKKWDKMKPEERVDYTGQAVDDFDDAEKFATYDWDKLPDWVTSSMYESKDSNINEGKIIDIPLDDIENHKGPFDYEQILYRAKKKGLDVIGPKTLQNGEGYPLIILYDIVKRGDKYDKQSLYINSFENEKLAKELAQKLSIMGIQEFYFEVKENKFIMFLDPAGNENYIEIK